MSNDRRELSADFVDWCDHFLATLVRIEKDSLATRQMGVFFMEFLNELADGPIDQRLSDAAVQAHGELQQIGLIEQAGSVQRIRPSRLGKRHAQDPVQLWEALCAIEVDDEEAQLIQAVNARSQRSASTYAMVADVALDELGLTDARTLSTIANQLAQDYGLVALARGIGNRAVHSTYRGLVWETRRGMLGASRWIDQLVAEWETTSVDFKRELETRTADQKAEFVKDVLGLANTQASGRRWMIIGFEDKTRSYWGAPNPKLNQDHLEHLLSQYTAPMVQVRYDVVDYRLGPVGTIEVLREPAKLPYQVARSIGDRKRIEEEQLFVRHGSQTEAPTEMELEAIKDEGRQARGE